MTQRRKRRAKRPTGGSRRVSATRSRTTQRAAVSGRKRAPTGRRRAQSMVSRLSARVPLVHGRAIEAEEVERIVGREFSPRQFASLCNALTWAGAGHCCTSIPSFTERVNAKDGGIDGEWDVEIPENAQIISAVLGPGWNVFQYRQRDALSQPRPHVVRALASGLRGALIDLVKRAGRRPQRYVLWLPTLSTPIG